MSKSKILKSEDACTGKCISPSKECSSEDFPAPTGPHMATFSPLCMLKLTFFSVRSAPVGSQLKLPSWTRMPKSVFVEGNILTGSAMTLKAARAVKRVVALNGAVPMAAVAPNITAETIVGDMEYKAAPYAFLS